MSSLLAGYSISCRYFCTSSETMGFSSMMSSYFLMDKGPALQRAGPYLMRTFCSPSQSGELGRSNKLRSSSSSSSLALCSSSVVKCDFISSLSLPRGPLSWEVTSFTRVNLDATTDLYYPRFALDERGVRHAPVPSELLALEVGTPAQGEDQFGYPLLLSPVRRHGPRRTASARRCWPVNRSPLSSEGSPGHEDAIVDQEAPYRVRRDVGLVGSVPQLLDVPLDLL